MAVKSHRNEISMAEILPSFANKRTVQQIMAGK